jgi:hypothetical protein
LTVVTDLSVSHQLIVTKKIAQLWCIVLSPQPGSG